MKNIIANDFNTITQNGKYVVDFYGQGCGACRMIEPFLLSLEEEYKEINFVKIDVDNAYDLAVQFGISSIPTLIFIEDGKILDTLVGLRPRAVLARTLDELFK